MTRHPVRKALLWIGGLLCGVGAAVIAASIAMAYMGLSASYNFGDPAKFQFVLVPFWQVGLGVAAIGAGCLAVSRWLKGGTP